MAAVKDCNKIMLQYSPLYSKFHQIFMYGNCYIYLHNLCTPTLAQEISG
jgi:hypothetical protein